jgi:hypothetical protein
MYQKKLDELQGDFNSRVRINTMDPEVNVKMQNNARAWFMQSLNSLTDELVEKFKDWQFNAEKNI